MIVELVAKKLFPLATASVFGIGMVTSSEATIDTVVIAKSSNSSYLCTDVIQLAEGEVPSKDSLELKPCNGISNAPLNVRILTINS